MERVDHARHLCRRHVRLQQTLLQLLHDDLTFVRAAHVKEACSAQAVRGAVDVVWHQDADGPVLRLVQGTECGQVLGALREKHRAVEGLPVEVGEEDASARPSRQAGEVPLHVLTVLRRDGLKPLHDLLACDQNLREGQVRLGSLRQPRRNGLMDVPDNAAPAAVAGPDRLPLLHCLLNCHRVAALVRHAEEVSHVGRQRIAGVRPTDRGVGHQTVHGVGSLHPLDKVALDEVLQCRHERRELVEAEAAPLLPRLDEPLQVLGHLATQRLAGRRGGLALAHGVQAADVPSVLAQEALVEGEARRGVVEVARLVLGQSCKETAQILLDLRQVGGGKSRVSACQRGVKLLEEGLLQAVHIGVVEVGLSAGARSAGRPRERGDGADARREALHGASGLRVGGCHLNVRVTEPRRLRTSEARTLGLLLRNPSRKLGVRNLRGGDLHGCLGEVGGIQRLGNCATQQLMRAGLQGRDALHEADGLVLDGVEPVLADWLRCRRSGKGKKSEESAEGLRARKGGRHLQWDACNGLARSWVWC
mmetsp:Transcript_46291/g.124373  ORF Transcript_46291/g.124373 Transcript_46291/m.124373 type:complete len:534 (+) Transcript_46291:616-2217(+)